MLDHTKLITTYKNHPFIKYVLIVAGIVLIYLIYEIHAWINTESTDNAYVDADISNVSSEINGVITNVLITDNMTVKAGDLIAEIDDRDYKSRLITLTASTNSSIQNIKILEQKILIGQLTLQQNQEALNAAQINFDVLAADFARNTKLHKEKFVSDKLLDNAKNAFEKAKTDLNQAKLSLEIAKQNLRLLDLERVEEEENLTGLKGNKNILKRSLENTKIISPINGVLGNSSLEVGNYINPGRILFSVVPEQMYITANFKETQIKKFRSGLKVRVQFDSLPKRVIYGSIRNISPATGSKFSLIPPDNATGNFTKIVQRVPVRIDFELPSDAHYNVVPGMSTIVSIRTDQK